MTEIVYVAGWARSGSTLLANLLGSVPGFVSVGELRDVWRLGFVENEPCGCGLRFLDCPFWEEVRRRLRGTISGGDEAAHLVEIQHRNLRVRHSPLLLLHNGQPGENPDLRWYSAVMAHLCQAISEAAGGAVVVDSSKYPADGALLAGAPALRPAYVHLVRDPRAVAYSWQRSKIREDRREPVPMPTYGSLYSTANWVAFNVLCESLESRLAAPAVRIRYEDLVVDPATTLRKILELVGRGSADLPIVDDDTAMVVESHTVNGNPDRRSGGRVRIRPDAEWETELSWRDRVLVGTIASPLMGRYDYSFRTSPSGRRAT